MGVRRIKSYCALCISRCGSIAVVEDGRLIAQEPDPSHPTGSALCAKGRAAPEIVYSPDRLLYPMKRTRPKGDPDPGWQRITWDEALDLTASRLRQIADESGPHTVAFSQVSASTSAISDAQGWIQRLMRAFGSVNLCGSMELCGWGRSAARFAWGTGMGLPGTPMPELEQAGCILFWGYNPSLSRISHATATVKALKRGARLIVVDPRRIGMAQKADVWLQVRPGTDAALALGIANVMIQRGWYDRDFIRRWSNGPLLVRPDTGALLRESDLSADGSPTRYVAWDVVADRPLAYDPATRRYEDSGRAQAGSALLGVHTVQTTHGELTCRTAFDSIAEACARYTPEVVAETCGVQAEQIEEAARLLWEARPVSYFAWSGVEQQTGSTQIARAISLLYALTGCFDAPGGNVQLPAVPVADVVGAGIPASGPRPPSLGLAERPLGPGLGQHTTSEELYAAILEGKPYKIRGLIGFGANVLMSHADSRRGREALAALDFYVHADVFMSPTAELADVVLPANTPFEREGLKVGFDVSAEAQSLVQLRQAAVASVGESRSDAEIVFDLAARLGLGEQFWNGDVDAAYRQHLGPSGVTLEQLRAEPGGIRVPLEARYRKYAEESNGVPRGFATPSSLVELYSETLLERGYPPLPTYQEPMMSPRSRPDLTERFPLILTCAKNTQFCETQHRAIPSLRRRSPEPEVELHPSVAAERGITAGDWVILESPDGAMRARARLNRDLDPNVVCGEHGWWQACEEIGAPAYDPFADDGSNYNLLIGREPIDPVSGSAPLRAYLCQVRPAE
ncbi:MAG: molybdopterin-dependent oxidoreductase [Chloroflexota bacterium]